MAIAIAMAIVNKKIKKHESIVVKTKLLYLKTNNNKISK
jgi:hypothetical protein